ncbi:uncharacterized protein BDV14DRAFT_202601 [Aspergillus stella-maris]|uniref:uncharacterized protein n=1 Tax=Aspergillus stella-maris TaxID=1810926 RepID=UPI003CCCA422
MIEQAQKHMEELDRLNADLLSAKSARLLRRLLEIEARAAEGDMKDLHSAQAIRVQSPENEPGPEPEGSDDKHVYIPYFGVIQAAGEIVSAPDATHPSALTVVPLSTLSGPFAAQVLSEDPMQLFEYPGMASEVFEDSTFQDMDLAFLDNLMRGTGESMA